MTQTEVQKIAAFDTPETADDFVGLIEHLYDVTPDVREKNGKYVVVSPVRLKGIGIVVQAFKAGRESR